MKTITEICKERRKEKGLTQKQLADKVGCAVLTILNFENDHHNIGHKNLEKIFNELDIELTSTKIYY